MSTARGTLPEMSVETDSSVPRPPPGQDVLPCSDGEPMETQRHVTQMMMLNQTLADAWTDRQDFFVAGDMFVYFSELQTRGEKFRGPDLFVVLDVEKKERKSWVAWEEGGRLPDVVIELLSDSTAHVDRGEKMRIYSRIWRTGEYVLYDPFTHELEGYALDPRRGGYVPIAKDARGDVPIVQMGLALGVRPGAVHEQPGPWLRWIRPDGEVLPTGRELAERERENAERERENAERMRVRAEEAERRLAELEAKPR